MGNDTISVIVPVYNAEKFLKRCLQSIINQTIDDFEVVLVNDGSTDSSLKIAIDFSKKDSRIRVINKENEGVSKTRNRGIEESKGKYICFIDSDDYVNPNFLEDLYSSINGEKDALGVCLFSNIYEGNHLKKSKIGIKGNLTISRNEYLIHMSKHLYSVYYGALWNKIYISKKIKDNCIRFDENISFAEDFIFNLEYLENVNKIVLIDKNNYYYNQENDNSLTRANDVNYLWEMAKIRFPYCVKQYKRMNMYEICEKDIDSAIATELIGPTYSIVKENYRGFNQAKKQLKRLYAEDYIKKAIMQNKRKNMVHRIARLSLRVNSYGMFVFLMRVWIKIQKSNG